MPDFYLVLDLEATCCDRESIPREQMETIEIGAVMVERKTLETISSSYPQGVAEFQTFIRPVTHPGLTEFCTQLTSITQADVDSAPKFEEAMETFEQWLTNYPNYLFCSWGKFDQLQIKKDCRLHEIPYPLGRKHFNLKTRFARSQRLKDRVPMLQALDLIQSPLEGTLHRGIDDARNLVKLLPYALGVKAIEPANDRTEASI
ncbi:exonuclease domain-containing protein [Phormidesmis sp. 146-35]